MSREANRRRLAKLMSQRRGGGVSGSRGPRLPDTPEFADAVNRFFHNTIEAYKQVKESGASQEELDAWHPRGTPEGRRDINGILHEIRRSRMPPAEAEEDRTQTQRAEQVQERMRRREEEESRRR